MSDQPPLIRLDGLTRRFGAVRALDGLDLVLDAREPIGLLGPNGAGKSTLIGVLLGLTPPSRGGAHVLGLDVTRELMEVRRRVGYLPEDDAWIDGMTGIETAAYSAELWGLPRRHALSRAHDVLGYVGLTEARHRPVEGYSRGMRQRLKLATALLGDPEMLLLDEPATGLDPPGRERMLALIEDLAGHGKAIMLSTHLLPDVERVCRHVVVMNRGRIVASGELAELTRTVAGADGAPVALRLRERSGRPEDLLRGTERMADALRQRGRPATIQPDGELHTALLDPADTAPLFALALELGLQVRRLEPVRRSLEHVFLEQVAGAPAGAAADPPAGAGVGAS